MLLALALYLPGIPKRARRARMQRALIESVSDATTPAERAFFEQGCRAVAILPLSQTVVEPLDDHSTPAWWVRCEGPKSLEASVATWGPLLPGGAVVETSSEWLQTSGSGALVHSVPVLTVPSAHTRKGWRGRVQVLLRMLDW